MVVFLIIAFLFWAVRVAKVLFYFFKLLEIKSFYRDALHITEVRRHARLKFLRYGRIDKMLVHLSPRANACAPGCLSM